MDLFLLRAVVGETASRLLEQELQRVAYLGRKRYLLRFATPRRDNLLISVRPDLPRMHLLGPEAGRQRESPADPFAAVLDAEIGGAVLRGIEQRDWDRVVTLRFTVPSGAGEARERRLVVELLGRSANLYCLDGTGSILAHARSLKSAFRAPLTGARYEGPPGRDDYEGIPAGGRALPAIRERFPDPASFLEPLSPVLAGEIRDAAAGDAEGAWRGLEAILEAAAGGAWAPSIYSRKPLCEMREGDAVGRHDLVVSALPLESKAGGGRYHASACASPSRATAEGLGLVERLRDFLADRAHHEALAAGEIRRLRTLIGKLERDRDRARECDRDRERAEALLAGLSSARVEDDAAIVPDPYDTAGGMLRVPIDRAQSLQDNAGALFARYKKGKRGFAIISRRLDAARERLSAWRTLAERARAVSGSDDLDSIREEMARLGLVHAPRTAKPGRPSSKKEKPARVRRHSTREGFDILVGKSGDENDTLTFRVASPWDFWLHAAGQPGAHVIVRNPRRLKKLPQETLRAAAGIAAFYSGARSETKAEVHYTQRKHVHKRKGMPSGQVIVRRFQSIQVAPRLPASSVEDL